MKSNVSTSAHHLHLSEVASQISSINMICCRSSAVLSIWEIPPPGRSPLPTSDPQAPQGPWRPVARPPSGFSAAQAKAAVLGGWRCPMIFSSIGFLEWRDSPSKTTTFGYLKKHDPILEQAESLPILSSGSDSTDKPVALAFASVRPTPPKQAGGSVRTS